MTLNLGVRGDYSKALAPEQDELDDNAQPTGRTFPRTDFFTWNSISPRLGVNIKLNSSGRTVIKSHWGRYHPQITTGAPAPEASSCAVAVLAGSTSGSRLPGGRL